MYWGILWIRRSEKHVQSHNTKKNAEKICNVPWIERHVISTNIFLEDKLLNGGHARGKVSK